MGRRRRLGFQVDLAGIQVEQRDGLASKRTGLNWGRRKSEESGQFPGATGPPNMLAAFTTPVTCGDWE